MPLSVKRVAYSGRQGNRVAGRDTRSGVFIEKSRGGISAQRRTPISDLDKDQVARAKRGRSQAIFEQLNDRPAGTVPRARDTRDRLNMLRPPKDPSRKRTSGRTSSEKPAMELIPPARK